MTPDELKEITEADVELPYSKKLDDNLQFIRDRITELRMLEGVSERSLGEEIGKGKSYIQQVSSGKITPALIPLLQLCERFGLEPQQFFDRDFHNPPLLREALEILKKQSDEDIRLAILFMRRLEK